MSEKIFCKPGDLLEYRCPDFGVVWQWHVHGVYLGASRQEGLVEISPVMAQPGSTGNSTAARVLVPEPMTRTLTVIRMVRNDALRAIEEGGE